MKVNFNTKLRYIDNYKRVFDKDGHMMAEIIYQRHKKECNF